MILFIYFILFLLFVYFFLFTFFVKKQNIKYTYIFIVTYESRR